MELYTSQGLRQCPYGHLTEQDLQGGKLFIKSSVGIPFSFGKDGESKRHTALLQEKILEAAACDASVLEARKKAVDIQKVERSIREAVNAWAEAAGELILLQMAKDLQEAAVKPVSTNCVWTDGPDMASNECFRKTISNNYFSSTVSIVRWKKYDPQAGELVWADTWHARWTLSTNCNTSHAVIKDIDRKFTDLEETRRYLQTQMDDLDKKYFYAMDPIIPLDMREYFLVHGMEIPGLHYEKG